MPRAADFGFDALAALEANNKDVLVEVFTRSGDANAINATVHADDTYGGSGAFGSLKREAGDTMLHLALRNKKWDIKLACVTLLAADCSIANEAGVSAPGLHVHTAFPRAASAVVATLVVHYGFLELGNLAYYCLCAYSLMGLVDLFLAVRWYGVAHRLFPFYWKTFEEYKARAKADKSKKAAKAEQQQGGAGGGKSAKKKR